MKVTVVTLLYIAAIGAGALLPLAFAPFNWVAISWLSPLLLLGIWEHTTSYRQAAITGWLYGVGLFTVGASWVYLSIHDYGNTNAALALIITIGFIALISLTTLAHGLLYHACRTQQSGLNTTIIYPGSWIIQEWLRSHFLTGFPWLLLGYAHVQSPFSGLLPVLGGLGITGFITLLAGLCYYLIGHVKRRIIPVLAITMSLLGLVLPLQQQQWTHRHLAPLKVALIQGNIDQNDAFDSQKIHDILLTYDDLTRSVWRHQLIIWPESAIPIPYRYVKDYVRQLSAKAHTHHASLLISLPIHSQIKDHYYNKIMALGTGVGTYAKQHLVPFGDYVPLESWLRGLIGFFSIPMSDFIAGTPDQPLLLVSGITIIPFICYDIAYSDYLLKNLPQGQLLVTVSNDAWFGHSIAAAQHLQIAQMRARQSGRYLLFTNNSGITAMIDPEGQIRQQLPAFQQATLSTQVYAMTGRTPWMRIGDISLVILSGLILFAIGLFRRI